jgi:hypothetical protein
MGAHLDLDDVAGSSELAQYELNQLREALGNPTNPRWTAWLIWNGEKRETHEFMIWIGQRWREWAKETGRHIHNHTDQDHADFDVWLIARVRNFLTGE